MNTIITISRQCGSGGRQIGRELASRLGIPFHDKQSLKQVARDMGLEDAISEAYPRNAGSILYQLAIGSYSFGYNDTSEKGLIGQNAPTVAFDAVKRVAKQGSCVIVGRCADYVLRDFPGLSSVFIHAPMPVRIKAAAAHFGLDTAQAEESVRKLDRLRRSYYNYYTDKNWGETGSYHLSLDSSALGIEQTVDLLRQYVTSRERTLNPTDNVIQLNTKLYGAK